MDTRYVAAVTVRGRDRGEDGAMKRMRPVLTAVTTLALLGAAGPAVAAPAITGEFDIPGGAVPGQLTQGPDGNVWVALNGGGTDRVARITPEGVVTGFAISAMAGAPTGLTTGPDGNLWATVSGGVVRFPTATPDTGDVFFPVAAITDPRRIVAGPDGNLWTGSSDKVLRITPAGVATPTTVTGLSARGIAAGTDGRMHVVDSLGGRIVSLSVTDPSVQTPTTLGGMPQEVATGPGGLVAFGNPGAAPQHVGRFTVGAAVATTDVPGSDPFGVTYANDGAFWFAQFATSTVSRMATDGTVTVLPGLSAASGARWITAGPGDTLWVSLETSKKVARITGVSAPPPVVTPPAPAPVVPSPAGPDVLAPQVSAVLAPKLLRAGRSGTFGVTLSEAAVLTLRFERLLPGRRQGKACVAPTRRNRKARLCTRRLVVGTVSAPAARAGLNAVKVGPRVGGRRLTAGRYRLTVSARDAAGNRSTARRLLFTVARARR